MYNKNKIVKLTTEITALALTITLTSCSGYSKGDKFSIIQNRYGELIVDKDNYISYKYINNYYVIELYNKRIDKTIIYIAHRLKFTTGNSKYTDIFTNYHIAYENNEDDSYEFISVLPLSDFLKKYNLIQEKYTYEDMQNIYDIIKKEYQKENDNILKKSLTIGNKV